MTEDANETQANKRADENPSGAPPGAGTPWYFWVVAGVALLWNGYGAFLWSGMSFATEAFLEGYPADYIAYATDLPVWSLLSWGVGVIGGSVASVLLLARHNLARPAFLLSLIGAATNSLVYITNPPPSGFFNLPLQLFIIGFAVFLLWFSDRMARRGILR